MSRVSVRAGASIALVALFLLGAASGGAPERAAAASTTSADPAADLEGTPIPLVEVGSWHCHDLDWPQIHCFRSEAALDAAVQALERASAPTGASAALTPSGPYVEVFQDINYGGSSAIWSQAYADLGAIGWNDTISSFKGMGGSPVGHFAVDINDGGAHDAFTSSSLVPNVGSTWNDRFSSVYPS